MADDGSKQSQNVWPIPKFRFEVRFGNAAGQFQEVSHLEGEVDPIEGRDGSDPSFSRVKMRGIRKQGFVTMKNGVFARDSELWAWFDDVKMNPIKRRTVTIALLDPAGQPRIVWTLANAWPVKITATDLKSDGSEVAVETLELAHEGVTIATG